MLKLRRKALLILKRTLYQILIWILSLYYKQGVCVEQASYKQDIWKFILKNFLNLSFWNLTFKLWIFFVFVGCTFMTAKQRKTFFLFSKETFNNFWLNIWTSVQHGNLQNMRLQLFPDFFCIVILAFDIIKVWLWLLLIGKGSTARISIARKQVFQLNPKIRCLVFVILEKKKILGKKSEFFLTK